MENKGITIDWFTLLIWAIAGIYAIAVTFYLVTRINELEVKLYKCTISNLTNK